MTPARIAIASSPWQHFDQTGARVGGLNYTTHVICHPLYTVYFILNPLTSSLLQKFQIPAKCQNALQLLPQETVLSQAHFNDLLNNYLAKLGSQQLARIREVATIALYHQQTDCPLVQTLCCDYAPIQVNHC
jgi:hypothetical protein